MKKFVLPISPEYVAHWGLWEAVREILERLREFSDKYAFMLTAEAKNDLNEIIEEAAKGKS